MLRDDDPHTFYYFLVFDVLHSALLGATLLLKQSILDVVNLSAIFHICHMKVCKNNEKALFLLTFTPPHNLKIKIKGAVCSRAPYCRYEYWNHILASSTLRGTKKGVLTANTQETKIQATFFKTTALVSFLPLLLFSIAQYPAKASQWSECSREMSMHSEK